MDDTYVPTHLTRITRQSDGWPKGIDEAGKQYATEAVAASLKLRGVLTLTMAKKAIYGWHGQKSGVPECLKGSTWDWLFAVTHRALLAAQAREVWTTEDWLSHHQFENTKGTE